MTDSYWPLKVLLAGVLLVGIMVALGLAWLISASDLPGWIKVILNSFIASFFVFGGGRARRKYRAGRSPWSLDKPERG